MDRNIYRMVSYLKSINTNPDKVIRYYTGSANDGLPSVMVWDKATNEICLWGSPLNHDKFKRMLSEVKTDYLHLSSVLERR